MLTIDQNSSPIVKIVGLDPGSVSLGVGVFNIDLTNFRIVSSDAWTLNGSKLLGKESWIESTHGSRVGRIASLEEELLGIFMRVQPNAIASESPFFNSRFPQAYGALTEVMCTIRRAVMHYDLWTPLHLIDPPTVKMAVGVKGNADKDQMKVAVGNLAEIQYRGIIPFEQLDEHSIDALAVAYSHYTNLRTNYV